MNIAYIGLGSNLATPLAQVEKAVFALSQIGIVTAQSSWYRSTAIGPGVQPDYINGAIRLETTLSAIELLDAMQAIENQQGRERSVRWGARNLDLDILLFNNDSMETDRLVIPHPRLLERNFVLVPLHEIAPQLIFSNLLSISEYLKNLSYQGLEKLV